MARSLFSYGNSGRARKPFFAYVPVDVLKECLDIVFLFCRNVINHIGVLPKIESEDDGKTGKVSELMITYENGVKHARARVVAYDGPADAARTAHFFYMRDKAVPASVFFDCRFS